MRGGRLDRKITLQRVQTTQDPAGEPEESWQPLSVGRRALVEPLPGSEQLGGEQLRAQQQYSFTIRWSPEVADLSPLDRIVYPADFATDSPSLASSVYDIWAVNEVGRHRALQIIAVRRSDTNP